jgi:hypothetical protein
LSHPEKIIIAVVGVLYSVGLDLFSNNNYNNTQKTINEDLSRYDMQIDKIESNWLNIKVFRDGGKYLLFSLPRGLSVERYYNQDYEYQIRDQYGNFLYRSSRIEFNKKSRSILQQIRTNWSDNALIQKALEMIGSLLAADEEMLPSRLKTPDLEESLEQMERQGLNG